MDEDRSLNTSILSSSHGIPAQSSARCSQSSSTSQGAFGNHGNTDGQSSSLGIKNNGQGVTGTSSPFQPGMNQAVASYHGSFGCNKGNPGIYGNQFRGLSPDIQSSVARVPSADQAQQLVSALSNIPGLLPVGQGIWPQAPGQVSYPGQQGPGAYYDAHGQTGLQGPRYHAQGNPGHQVPFMYPQGQTTPQGHQGHPGQFPYGQLSAYHPQAYHPMLGQPLSYLPGPRFYGTPYLHAPPGMNPQMAPWHGYGPANLQGQNQGQQFHGTEANPLSASAYQNQSQTTDQLQDQRTTETREHRGHHSHESQVHNQASVRGDGVPGLTEVSQAAARVPGKEIIRKNRTNTSQDEKGRGVLGHEGTAQSNVTVQSSNNIGTDNVTNISPDGEQETKQTWTEPLPYSRVISLFADDSDSSGDRNTWTSYLGGSSSQEQSPSPTESSLHKNSGDGNGSSRSQSSIPKPKSDSDLVGAKLSRPIASHSSSKSYSTRSDSRRQHSSRDSSSSNNSSTCSRNSQSSTNHRSATTKESSKAGKHVRESHSQKETLACTYVAGPIGTKKYKEDSRNLSLSSGIPLNTHRNPNTSHQRSSAGTDTQTPRTAKTKPSMIRGEAASNSATAIMKEGLQSKAIATDPDSSCDAYRTPCCKNISYQDLMDDLQVSESEEETTKPESPDIVVQTQEGEGTELTQGPASGHRPLQQEVPVGSYQPRKRMHSTVVESGICDTVNKDTSVEEIVVSDESESTKPKSRRRLDFSSSQQVGVKSCRYCRVKLRLSEYEQHKEEYHRIVTQGDPSMIAESRATGQLTNAKKCTLCYTVIKTFEYKQHKQNHHRITTIRSSRMRKNLISASTGRAATGSRQKRKTLDKDYDSTGKATKISAIATKKDSVTSTTGGYDSDDSKSSVSRLADAAIKNLGKALRGIKTPKKQAVERDARNASSRIESMYCTCAPDTPSEPGSHGYRFPGYQMSFCRKCGKMVEMKACDKSNVVDLTED